MLSTIRPSTAWAPSPSPLASSLALAFAAGVTSCSSSNDDTPVAPDVTAPATQSFVQDRGTDPSGQTIAVTFTEAVTPATAEVAANYTLSGGVSVNSATLRSGGRIVDLALDAPAIPGDNTIAIAAGIEDAAGNASEEVTATAITSTDTTAPAGSAIEGVTVSGAENDMIVVTFSDNMIEAEVESLANWNIEAPEGTPFDITGATVDYDDMTRTATVTLGAGATDQNLQTFDDIHATFITMRDLGGNVIGATVIGTTAVNGMVGGDTTPPTLTAAARGSSNIMSLTFSEAITRAETPDLRSGGNPTGTDIVFTDASDPGAPSEGVVRLDGLVLDGDSVTISDGVTATTFEFDYGAVGTFALSGQPNDGDSVTVSDGSNAFTFEFDNNDVFNDVEVNIGGASSATISNLITAMNAQSWSVTASPGGTSLEIDLRNDNLGAAGNVPITNNDTATVQSFTGMAGGGVSGSNVAVAVDTSVITTDTVPNLRDAINAQPFNVTAVLGGNPEDVAIINNNPGVAGNVPITESEAGNVITVTGMAGGQDSGTASHSATSAAILPGGLQASVGFGSALEIGDSVRVLGVTDLAGNQLIPVASASVVAIDSTPPALDGSSTVIVNSGEFNDRVVIDFNADIHPDGALDLANYTVDGASAVDIAGATAMMTASDAVTLRFGKGSNVNLDATVAHTVTANGIKNLQGAPIAVAESDAAITPLGDTLAPTIGVSDARLDPNTAEAAIFTFGEAISETGGIDIANYTLVGNATVSASFLTARVVRVVFTSALSVSDSVDIAVAAVTDLGGNAAGGVATVALAAADGTVPTVTSVTATAGASDGRDTIAIVFSEPIATSLATVAANYTITSGGAPVSLAGASLTESSVNDSVTIQLAEGISLQTGDSMSVAIANLTDTSGNALSSAPATTTVAGDASPPTAADSFVNVLVEAAGTIIDVQFEEAMDPTTTMAIANWTGSDGQSATAVTRLNPMLYRVTFDAPIAPADTVDVATPTDRAGNAGGTITLAPAE